MILTKIIAITLLTWGIFYLIRTNFPYLKRFKSVWLKPVWGCIICSGSFWGSVGYWLLSFQDWQQPEAWSEWVVVCCAVSGLNFMLGHWFEVDWND